MFCRRRFTTVLFIGLFFGGVGITSTLRVDPTESASAAGPVTPIATPFAISNPNDGEAIDLFSMFMLKTEHPSAHHANVSVNGVIVGTSLVTSVETEVLVDTGSLDNGLTLFTAELFDANGQLLGDDDRHLIVQNPTLAAGLITNPDGTRSIEAGISGVCDDQAYVVLAANELDVAFSAVFGTFLPIDFDQSVTLTADLFPTGYTGSQIDVVQPLGPSSGSSPIDLYLVLVTFNSGEWSVSKAVHVSDTPPPAPSAIPPLGGVGTAAIAPR